MIKILIFVIYNFVHILCEEDFGDVADSSSHIPVTFIHHDYPAAAVYYASTNLI